MNERQKHHLDLQPVRLILIGRACEMDSDGLPIVGPGIDFTKVVTPPLRRHPIASVV